MHDGNKSQVFWLQPSNGDQIPISMYITAPQILKLRRRTRKRTLTIINHPMASHTIPIALLVSLSLLIPSALAGVICEDLPEDLCAFSISSSGKRCLLESYRKKGGGGPTHFHCKTSEVAVEKVSGWIETDDCVKACGADRRAVGISSDALLDPHFTAKLCSAACYQSCPNIVDLYFHLAAGEGVFLPELCEARRLNPHRSMVELVGSSGTVAGDAAAPSPSA